MEIHMHACMSKATEAQCRNGMNERLGQSKNRNLEIISLFKKIKTLNQSIVSDW